MTFIVAVICNKGVVVASDCQSRRVTDNNATKIRAQKIFEFGENKLWGSSGDEYQRSCFMSFLNKIKDENEELSHPYLYALFDRFANNMRKKIGDCEKRPCNEFLIVEHNEIPFIWKVTNDYYKVHYFGEEHYQQLKDDGIVAIGAGQTVPRTFFNRLKSPGRDFSVEQGCIIGYRLVMEAIDSSVDVGPPVDVWTIQNEKIRRKSKADCMELKELCNRWKASEQLMSEMILFSVR
jgi:20S proteasome alpha/beta subunit